MAFLAAALQRLNATISEPNSRTADNIMATDNAVSALGKICEYQRDSIDGANVRKFTFSSADLASNTGVQLPLSPYNKITVNDYYSDYLLEQCRWYLRG